MFSGCYNCIYTQLKISMELIPLFMHQLTEKDKQYETCQAIPQNHLLLNAQLMPLLDRPNPISIITSIVHSHVGNKMVKDLLMLNNQQQQIKNGGVKDMILMGNKLQVGYSSIAEPYNWLYFQIDSSNKNKLVSMITSISCTLIYESQSLEYDRKYLQQIAHHFKSITGRFPHIYYLTHQANVFNYSFDFQFIHQIQLPKPNKFQNHQFGITQSLNQYSRKVLNQNFVLQTKKAKIISSCVLPCYFNKWSAQCNKIETSTPQNIWIQSVTIMQEQLKNKSLQIYKSRMAKIYEDKKFVPLKLMYSSHEIALEISLKSLQKYKYENQDLIHQLNDLLLLELDAILQTLTELNFKWSKTFIQTEFAQIQNRLKTKDIKQINSFKHQLSAFIDYFHKKTELISCKKIQQYFQHFIVAKSLDCSNLIYEGQKRLIIKQLNETKQKIGHLENDSKQFRRQKIKQTSQNTNLMEEMQQKINYSKNRQQFLQSALAQLKNERQTMDITYDNRIHEMQQKFLQQLKLLQQSKSGALEQSADLKRKIVLLQAEIQKQREMHKQSHDQYKLMINEFRIKQLQLHDELSEITIKSSQQLQMGRRQLERSLNKSSINKTQKQRETLRLIEDLNEMNTKYLQLEKQYKNLQYQIQLKDSQKQQEKRELQVTLKIAEQKIYQLQNKLQRYQKMQDHMIETEKAMEQIMNERKQVHKEVALLKQQNKFISEQFRQSQLKLSNERMENLQLKNSLEEVQDKIAKLDKVKVSEWTQTQFDNKLKRQLQDALKMTITLQAQYRKIKLENNKLKYRLT